MTRKSEGEKRKAQNVKRHYGSRFTHSASPSTNAIPGSDDITRTVLPNGIVILTRANFNSPSVVISGSLTAGSLFVTPDKLGLADFTASMLMRGAGERGFQQIYDALESVGASLSFGGGTHTTSFGGRALAEDLDVLLQLVADCLRRPTFPAEQVERLRAQLLTGLAIRAQDTGEMASMTFDQIIYANHPYQYPEDGYPETVQAITRDDLAAFHRKHFGPKGMILTVVGAVEPSVVVEKVAAALGDWQNLGQPEPPVLPDIIPLASESRRKFDIPGKSQSDLAMGLAGPLRRSPDFVAASLGNSVLGQFGMFGRIGDVVREQAGLAYYAFSNLSGGLGPGPWYISAGVDPANVEQAIELIRKEIARFVTEPVSEAELSDSQANFIGRMPLSLETNAGVASALLNIERYSLGLDYYRCYPDLIRSITREDVLAAAQKYLHPDRLGIAVAGS